MARTKLRRRWRGAAQVGDAADAGLLPEELRGSYSVGRLLGKGAHGCVFEATKVTRTGGWGGGLASVRVGALACDVCACAHAHARTAAHVSACCICA